MQPNRHKTDFFTDSMTPTANPDQLRVLVVGETLRGDMAKQAGDGNTKLFLAFESLTPDRFSDIAPDVVLSPLVTPRFDCLELAGHLANFGYEGRYRALAPKLPRPDLVKAEVRNQFPSLDFDLLFVEEAAVSGT